MFFVQQERELYLRINTRLHMRRYYENFALYQVFQELNDLQSLCDYTTTISSYVNLNIQIIYRILSKFDKKYKKYKINFTKEYILECFERKNSDLLYIYAYKILDEVGALLEQLVYELQIQYEILLENPNIQLNNENLNKLKENENKDRNSESLLEKGNLLIENNSENSLSFSNNNSFTIKKLTDEEISDMKNKFKDLNKSIYNMEAFYQSTSSIFQKWMIYVKENEFKSHTYSVKTLTESNEKNKNSTKEKHPHLMSNESYWNIRLTLLQSFIMAINNSYIFPIINIDVIKDNYLIGAVISMTFLGILISSIIFGKVIHKTYKIPMILSCIFSLMGNASFLFGNLCYQTFLFFIGRFLVGFGMNTIVHRKYLLYFIPKRKITKYLILFKAMVLTGNCLGPLLLSILSFLIKNDNKNNYNNDNGEKKEDCNINILDPISLSTIICGGCNFLMLLLIIILYSEPISPKFVVYAKGLAPTDTASRADSFAIDNTLTNYESEKLDEINKKVRTFNDENQFDDTNLVTYTIGELIDQENEPKGNIRRAFWFIMIFIFILNFSIMSYLFLNPYYFCDIWISEIKQYIISFSYFIIFLIIIPAYFINYFYISEKFEKTFYIGILWLIQIILQIICTVFIIKSNDESSTIFYYISFSLTIVITYILIDQFIYFYTQIIPSDFKILKLSGFKVLHYMENLGNIGGCLVSLLAKVFISANYLNDEDTSNQLNKFMMIVNIVIISIQLISMMLFMLNRKRFRDRPIRRLIYSKNVRKLKRIEF